MSANQFRKPDEQLLEDIKAVVGASGWKSPQDGPSYFEDPAGALKAKDV